MGRPIGSQNKDKPYRDALRRAIARAQDEDAPHKLDRIAENHLKRALLEDAAVKELADRIDGKVATPIAGTDDDGNASGPLVIRWEKQE